MGRPWDSVTTRLFGRAEELRCAEETLEQSRVVTITGTAGVGKTRLAKELLRRRSEPFVFVDVTEVRGVDALCEALADALGVGRGATSGASATRIGEVLAARGRILVLLDNFEHNVSFARASVAVWAEMAPLTRIIVTSRERLHLEVEATLDIAPLSTPPAGASTEEAVRFDAVQLFLARARGARGAVAEEPDDVDAIAEIVRRLDGVPLAIELSAARADVLSPRQILARLGRPFELLSAPSQEAPSRRSALREAVACSWNLLDDDERRALSECAVFRGGFTLEAAEEVTSGRAGSVVDRVQALVRKSLLQSSRGRAPSEPVRLRLFESVRAFVLEIAPPPRDAEERHAAYYLRLGEDAADRVGAATSPADRLTLIVERENLLAVLEREERRAAADPSGAAHIKVARALATLGLGPAASAAEPWSARLSAALFDLDARGAAPRLRARLRVLCAAIARRLGRLDAVSTHLREALSLLQTCEAPGIAAEALLGEALLEQAAGRSGASLLTQAHELAVAAELPALAAAITGHAGWGRFLEDPGAAHAALESVGAALHRARAIGDPAAEALSRRRLGAIYACLGRVGASRSELSMALDLSRATGEREIEAEVHASLGMLAVEAGDVTAANEAYEAHRRALSAQSAPHERASLRVVGAWIQRAFGDSNAAEASVRAALEEALPAPEARAMRCLLASILADRGEPGGAEAELATARESIESTSIVRMARAHIALARARAAERDDDLVAAAAERRALSLLVRDARVCSAPPSPPALRIAARVLLQRIEEAPPSRGSLVLGPDAAWFQAPGVDPVGLEKRKALRGILTRLAAERVDRPGAALDLEALVRAGWPGARLSHESARNRVHVAVSTLRRMGLRRVLLSLDDGWLLDPAIAIVRRVDATLSTTRR